MTKNTAKENKDKSAEPEKVYDEYIYKALMNLTGCYSMGMDDFIGLSEDAFTPERENTLVRTMNLLMEDSSISGNVTSEAFAVLPYIKEDSNREIFYDRIHNIATAENSRVLKLRPIVAIEIKKFFDDNVVMRKWKERDDIKGRLFEIAGLMINDDNREVKEAAVLTVMKYNKEQISNRKEAQEKAKLSSAPALEQK